MAVRKCVVPIGAHIDNAPMEHTQPTQHNNSHPCVLVLSQTRLLPFPRWTMAMCVCFLMGYKHMLKCEASSRRACYFCYAA
jgi:hypothetical protein